MPFNVINSIAKLPKKMAVIVGTNTNAPSLAQLGSVSTINNYYQPAMSDSGQYIIATVGSATIGTVLLSTNYGSTFSSILTFTNLINYSCAMSGTGQYMVVMVNNGYMYRSGNYGVNWAQVTNISTTQNWTSVALSPNGQYCLASGNNPTNNVYVSANFNTSTPTFTQVSLYANMNNGPQNNAVSSTGQYMIQLNWSAADGIAISTNYGVSFSKLTVANIGITGTSFNGITMTPDKSSVYVAIGGNGLYKSTNLFSGSPMFTQITTETFTEQTWNKVVVSSDGTYIIASTSLNTYYSKNSGSTWTKVYVGRITFMAMSSDAHYVIASNSDRSSSLLYSNT